MKSSRLSKLYTALIFFCLYLPIFVMILFSFNESKSMTNFTGFSWKWYGELFQSGKAFDALKYSLLIALLSALISTVIGTLAAYGIHRMRRKWLYRTTMSVTNIPMMNPDIVTGISMLLLFAFIQVVLGLQNSLLGFGTLLIAHITFNVPYVILSVLPKFKQMDKNLSEAALDLGCTPVQVFTKIELPAIMPGVVSGAIMAFTLSLDDFVISNFTIGTDFQTLPILIYSMTKREVTPDMNALCSIMFVVIFILLLLSNFVSPKTNDKIDEEDSKEKKPMKKQVKILAVLLVVLVAVSIPIASLFVKRVPYKTLNVYNWGEYISDGSEESLDVIALFESWYEETYGERVQVNYTTYSSNEDLYNKLSSGASDYDVIIPSDYMIAKMAEEGMLAELDYSLIPNYEYILDDFKGLFYDKDEKYSVPYTYGVVGIIYDSNAVDAKDVTGWDLMWNRDYAGKILQYNNPRDAFGTAMYKDKVNVNTTDKAVWDQILASLSQQKPLVQSYVMDEIYNKMESGEALISSYYAGDYLFMYQNNDALAFYQPEDTNFFIDAMCIPKSSRNQELANVFINFMLSEEVAVANAEYICYASPNALVLENEDYVLSMEELHENAMDILYPTGLDFSEKYEAYAYRNLSPEMNEYMNSLWSRLKISSGDEEGSGFDMTYAIALAIVLAVIVLLTFHYVRKKRRAKYYS